MPAQKSGTKKPVRRCLCTRCRLQFRGLPEDAKYCGMCGSLLVATLPAGSSLSKYRVVKLTWPKVPKNARTRTITIKTGTPKICMV